MECSDCGVRSAVGYCHECETMLCEVCGRTCERCGRVSCRSHLQRTSSGRNICVSCVVLHYDKRARQSKERRERRAEETALGGKTRKHHKPAAERENLSFEALAGDMPALVAPIVVDRPRGDIEPHIDDDEFRDDHRRDLDYRRDGFDLGTPRGRDALNARVLTGSASTRTPPWISGLAMGGLSWLLCLAIGGDGPDIQKAIFNLVALITSAGTVVWTGPGAFGKEATPERTRCRIALGVGLGALLLSGTLYALRWLG